MQSYAVIGLVLKGATTECMACGKEYLVKDWRENNFRCPHCHKYTNLWITPDGKKWKPIPERKVMSWTAHRYRPGFRGADPNEPTAHHVPPKSPRRYFTREVKRSHHDAYHHIFGTPRTYEEACQILWDKFWKPPN